MPKLPTPLGRRLREILGDGEWHSFLALYAATRDLIPPEVATRRHVMARTSKMHYSRLRGVREVPGTGAKRLPEDAAVEAGRKLKVYHTVANMGAEQRGSRDGEPIYFRFPEGKPRWVGSAWHKRARADAADRRPDADPARPAPP